MSVTVFGRLQDNSNKDSFLPNEILQSRAKLDIQKFAVVFEKNILYSPSLNLFVFCGNHDLFFQDSLNPD